MIKIKGHSNFKVEIKNIDNIQLISKSSNNKDRNRLNNQIKKQIYMYENNIFNNVCIPKIIKKIDINIGVEYLMEYIYNSENCIDFLLNNNIIKIDKFINDIIEILQIYINNCTNKKINKNVLFNKIDDVKNIIFNNKFLNDINIQKYIDYLYADIDEICKLDIPIGICHGDFTLSNILIDPNNMKLYLIDFLDSFIETPFFDIIKLRQDTKYYWTLNLCNFEYDNNKILIILNYIDKKIDNYFEKYDFYRKGYKYFQILNILRVLQYCKEDKIKNKLFTILNSIYNIK